MLATKASHQRQQKTEELGVSFFDILWIYLIGIYLDIILIFKRLILYAMI